MEHLPFFPIFYVERQGIVVFIHVKYKTIATCDTKQKKNPNNFFPIVKNYERDDCLFGSIAMLFPYNVQNRYV